MKIAQVCHVYLPHIGGIEYYIKRLVQNLDDEDISSQVLTTDFRTPVQGRKKEAIYFKTSFAFMRNPFSFELLRYLKKNSFDVIHIHNVWFLAGLIAVYFRKNARVITTMHGVYPDSGDFILRFFLRLYRPCAHYILQKSVKVIVLSFSEKEKLESIFQIPSEKIMIIHNGINIENYQEILRQNVILFTGRVIPHKNPDLLIKAVARLSGSLQSFKVVFVGPVEENYKKYLIRLSRNLNVANEIQFFGQLDQSVHEEKIKLMDMYRQARVFVSLGSWEGMPTRIMEAMQFKTPAIAYVPGGNSELITDKMNGVIIGKLDAEMLANKLKDILSDESFAGSLGEKARATIVHLFDWHHIFRSILRVYKE